MEKVFEPIFSFEDLCRICQQADVDATRDDALNMSRYRKDFTDALVGKEFSCRFDDGQRLVFRFPEINRLLWSADGEVFHEEYCAPMKSTAGNVVGVYFLRRHVLPFEGAFTVFDLDTGYVTWVSVTIGADFDEKFAHPFPHFGEIENFGTHSGEKHHYSTDLVGKSIDWQYNEQFTIRHSYVTPWLTISPHMPEKGADEEEDEDYVGRRFLRAFNAKIRDGLVLTSFTEPGNCCAVLLIDMKLVHDVGCFFGITYEGKLSGVTVTAMGGYGGAGLKQGDEMGYAKPAYLSEEGGKQDAV